MSRTGRALTLSVLLHMALLFGWVGIDYDLGEASPSLRVTLVDFDTSNAESSGPEPATTNPLPVDPLPTQAVEQLEPSAPKTSDASEPPTEQANATVEQDLPAETATGRGVAVQAASPNAPDNPSPAADQPSEPDVQASQLEPLLVANIPALKPPPPPTAALNDEELQMLQAKAEDWASEAVELAADAAQVSWSQDGRDYVASFALHPAEDSMGIDTIMVAVQTDRDGERFATELRMQRLAFSSFAQFVDRWDPSVRIHDDEIDGRFHSNSDILLEHSRGIQPTFHGKVTTARNINTSRSERRVVRDEVFLGGLQTRVGRIALPKRFELAADRGDPDPRHTHHFPRSARILFHADGSYSWQYLDSDSAAELVRLPAADPYYLIAADKAELHVQGILNGKVLVYAPQGIVIEDDLVYAVNPEIEVSSDDYLGLVSDQRVEIAPPATTGPGDLHVQASIYAKRRFAVTSYRTRELGTLHLYGSLTAGSLSATEPRYRTKLVFDRRLKHLRPPSFPQSDRFEAVAWDQHWTAVQAHDPG